MVALRAVLLSSWVWTMGCASTPPKPNDPPKSDPEAKTKGPKTPQQLCEKYVSLAEENGKLDDDARKYKLEKCIGKAKARLESTPKLHECMVDCTFSASSYASARACPSMCANGDALDDEELPKPK